MTKPNGFDESRQRWEREERRRRIVVKVLDGLTALALIAIGVLVLTMIFH